MNIKGKIMGQTNQDNKIIIFDTTLRDGEQSPGASMNKAEKLRIATQLEKLGVDVIEAGFPAASEDDFLAVKTIAETLKNTQVAALCRTAEGDINRGWEAIKNAAHPRIHTFLATSDLHMEYKLKMNREQVIAQTIKSVRQAASFTDNVEFSAEDGSRSRLCDVLVTGGDPLDMRAEDLMATKRKEMNIIGNPRSVTALDDEGFIGMLNKYEGEAQSA